jgi:hypothetical protein
VAHELEDGKFATVTAEGCDGYCQHLEALEQYWEGGGIVTDMSVAVIIGKDGEISSE